MPISTCLSIIILNISGLNVPTKRYRVVNQIFKKRSLQGVPIMVQQKQIRLGTMRLWIQSLALLGGLRIWRCHELWYRTQMQLGSGIAVSLAQAGSNCSDQTPSLGTSICYGCSPKKKKKPARDAPQGKRHTQIENERMVKFLSWLIGNKSDQYL